MEVTPLADWTGSKGPCVIAGPCAAESEEQVRRTAEELSRDERVSVYRAGIWKPRTRPGCFEGVGKVGLDWLRAVKNEFGLLTITEVATPYHVDACLAAGIDVFWVGARTTTSPFAVQEVAGALRGADVPVLVKNPMNPDLGLWIGALERLHSVGIKKLGAIHRGFTPFQQSIYRNAPNWQIPIELKRRLPGLPLLSDPSHIAGNTELIKPVAQKALDLAMDGLMIEAHIDPTVAKSDKSQQLRPAEISALLDLLSVRSETSANHGSSSSQLSLSP